MSGTRLRVSEQEITESASGPLRLHDYEEQAPDPTYRRLQVLLECRYFLVRAAAWGLVLSTILAFLIPSRFESRTQLMPPDAESGGELASLLAMASRSGSGLGMLAGDLLGVKTSGSLFIGILRSRTVEDRIIDRFNLKSVYKVRRMETARRRLEENTQISEDRKSGIIAIGVSDHSPERAAAMAQAYVSELDRLVVELNTSAAHRERVFLEQRLKTVKQDLDSSAKDFSEFASKNTAIDIKEQGRAMLEAAANLEGHLIAAQSELEGLRQIYSDNYVRVRALRARIDELQKKLDQIGGGNLSPTLAPQDTDGYPSIRKLPLLGVTYSDLYRRTKIQETLFELLTQQCELAKVQEAKETPSVKILDAPVVPERKSFPPRLFIMFIGAFFGLIVGVLWVLGTARWESMAPQHPGKILAQDAYEKLKQDVRRTSEAGRRLQRVSGRVLWFRK